MKTKIIILGLLMCTLLTTAQATPCLNPSQDLDGDGLYEDVNGNGILDFDDVVTLYDNMEMIEQTEQGEYFDFNGNGILDFDDVVILYDML